MIPTSIRGLLFISLILFQYAEVSLGMDPSPSTPRLRNYMSQSNNARERNRRYNLSLRLQGEIQTLTAEQIEANRYFSAGHDPIPRQVYLNWIGRLQQRIDSAGADYLYVINVQHIPERFERQWYQMGTEKRSAMHELVAHGYSWVDLDPRPQNQRAIFQSEQFRQLWQDIGNMNEEFSKLSHIRDHLGDDNEARILYNRAMTKLQGKITDSINYSRELASGNVRPEAREYYQPGTIFQELRNAFNQYRMDWDQRHAHIPPPPLPRRQ